MPRLCQAGIQARGGHTRQWKAFWVAEIRSLSKWTCLPHATNSTACMVFLRQMTPPLSDELMWEESVTQQLAVPVNQLPGSGWRLDSPSLITPTRRRSLLVAKERQDTRKVRTVTSCDLHPLAKYTNPEHTDMILAVCFSLHYSTQ